MDHVSFIHTDVNTSFFVLKIAMPDWTLKNRGRQSRPDILTFVKITDDFKQRCCLKNT